MFSSLHRRLNKKDSSSETTDPNLISIGDGDGGDDHSITITNARHENGYERGYECGYEYEHGSKRSSVSRGKKPTRQKKKNGTFTYAILVLLIIITLPILIVNFRIEAPNEQQQLQLIFTQNEGNGTAKSDQQKVIVQQRYNKTTTRDEQQQVMVQNKYNGTANEHDDQQQQLIVQNNKDNQIDCDGCNAEGKGAETEGKETAEAEAEAAVAPEVCGKVTGDEFLIPRRLIFTHEKNMLERKEPSHLYNNVQRTIQMYSKFWNQSTSEVDVWFLDNKECLKLIEQVEPRLVQPFLLEPYGAYQGDICRIAALYLCGGYYFDVDIEALEPLKPEPHIDFITAIDYFRKGFFQAVLATSPSHPVLKLTFDSMINDWYFNPVMAKHNMTGNTSTFDPDIFYSEDAKKILHKNVGHDLMGPITIYRAYFRYNRTNTSWILKEIDNLNDQNRYHHLRRRQYSWSCHMIVHDEDTRTPYFFSRVVGTPLCLK